MTTDFPKLIKEKRKKMGLSQAKIASLLGVSWITIWRWENKICIPKEDAIDYWKLKINSL